MSTMLKFKTRNRDRLFFDQFRYGLRCRISHITAIRNYTGDFEADSVRTHRMLDLYKRWHSHVNGVKFDAKDYITPWERNNVIDFLSQLCGATDPVRTAVSNNIVWVYSNDLEFLKGLAKSGEYDRRPEITEVHLDRPRDSIMLKKSDYQYRTYFRDCNLTLENRQYLQNWIHNQQGIRLSPGLQEWITKDWRNLYSNYFFDHCDMRLTQILGLIVPQAIKTTKTIVVADK